MKNLALSFLIIVTLSSTSKSEAQILSSPSKTYQLANLPSVINRVSKIAEFGKKIIINRQSDKEYKELELSLKKKLKIDGQGYLVIVNYYESDLGTPIIPGGKLLWPVGAGENIVSAYGEAYLDSFIKPSPPSSNSIDLRKLIFFHNCEDKICFEVHDLNEKVKLQVKDYIKRAKSKSLIKQASEGIKLVKLSERWTAIRQKYDKNLADAKKVSELNFLQNRMASIEEDINQDISEFMELKKQYKASQARYSSIDLLNSFEGFLSTFGEFTDDTAQRNNDPFLDSREKLQKQGELLLEKKAQIIKKVEGVAYVEERLIQVYKQNNITVQKHRNFDIPELEINTP